MVNAFSESETSTNETVNSTDGDILHYYPQNLILSESGMKIISLAEYNNLMQLVPKLAKLEVTIRAMDEKLKKKDILISQMKNDFQRKLKDRDRNHFSDSLHLTTVSKFPLILWNIRMYFMI